VSKKRLQNKVAESRMALPIVAMYALAVSILCGLLEGRIWLQFGMLIVSALSMMVLNNVNALIRIYSRMVSCSFIVLFIMTGALSQTGGVLLVQLCAVLFYLILFRAYQDKNAMGIAFYSFMMLGIASTAFMQVLFFVPVAWILLFTNIMAGNTRTIMASILGLVIPYWFVGGYCIYTARIDDLVAHFKEIAQFGQIFNYGCISVHQIVTFSVISMLSLISIVHFHRNSYKDKIRTRMLYEIFFVMDICTAIFVILQPQHYNFLIGIMVVNTAPLIAHFIALTNTRITNAAFFVILAIVLAATIYNVWMPSLTF